MRKKVIVPVLQSDINKYFYKNKLHFLSSADPSNYCMMGKFDCCKQFK